MSIRTYTTEIIPESSTAVVTVPLLDEDGAAIANTDLTTLVFTLADPDGTIVNGRSDVDIFNAGPGAIDGSGVLTLTLTPADTAVATAIAQSTAQQALAAAGIRRPAPRAYRVVVLEWTYSAGAKTGRHEVWLPIAQVIGVGS